MTYRTPKYLDRRGLRDRLTSVHSAARIYGSSFEWLLSEKKRLVWDTPDFRRLTIADKSYLRGYADALFDQTWHSLRWQQFSTVDYRWHDAFDIPGEEWSRLYSAQCRPGENGDFHIAHADTSRFCIGSYAASNSGMPGRHVWPESHHDGRTRVFSGDSVVESNWSPGPATVVGGKVR